MSSFTSVILVNALLLGLTVQLQDIHRAFQSMTFTTGVPPVTQQNLAQHTDQESMPIPHRGSGRRELT